jgi:hypothetical protein
MKTKILKKQGHVASRKKSINKNLPQYIPYTIVRKQRLYSIYSMFKELTILKKLKPLPQ